MLVIFLYRNWNIYIFFFIFVGGIIEYFVLLFCFIIFFSLKVGRIGWKWIDFCDVKINFGWV